MDFQWQQILVMATLAEAIVTGIKPIYDKEKGWNLDMLWSLLASLIISVLGQIDVFEAVGITLSVPYVGFVLTGIIGARGANVVHDVIKVVSGYAGARAIDPLKK